jgi:predicted DNA-binding transcriptional regulator AlpA
MNHELKELIEMLQKTYHCFELSRKQCAEVLGKSTATIDRLRSDGLGPGFKKDDRSKNGRVTYPIVEVARYIQAGTIETYEASSWN